MGLILPCIYCLDLQQCHENTSDVHFHRVICMVSGPVYLTVVCEYPDGTLDAWQPYFQVFLKTLSKFDFFSNGLNSHAFWMAVISRSTYSSTYFRRYMDSGSRSQSFDRDLMMVTCTSSSVKDSICVKGCLMPHHHASQ